MEIGVVAAVGHINVVTAYIQEFAVEGLPNIADELLGNWSVLVQGSAWPQTPVSGIKVSLLPNAHMDDELICSSTEIPNTDASRSWIYLSSNLSLSSTQTRIKQPGGLTSRHSCVSQAEHLEPNIQPISCHVRSSQSQRSRSPHFHSPASTGRRRTKEGCPARPHSGRAR